MPLGCLVSLTPLSCLFIVFSRCATPQISLRLSLLPLFLSLLFQLFPLFPFSHPTHSITTPTRLTRGMVSG
ncbi:hypothetical protein B0F90DRAFT_1781012 [Multifurca ochricompacta]|uniref:Uncharacterized protein n=1 Tax=Multifurca ochricompacta TaxID=376703 RepID=A0AAD4QHG8_9AGAM|nr:hypothetical protein B0F90DRAFT_1781012 [Multifurca ochricompacta]